MLPLFFFSLFIVQTIGTSSISDRYTPDWKSLDSRPLPRWYDEAKFGIFIHWGLYSVPSFGSEWFWWYWKGNSPDPYYVKFMQNTEKPGFKYADFAARFTAEFFDADAWAQLLEKSGAKYVVLTSKHHEGYCMYPSKYSWNWNSWDVGAHRDLAGELAKAVRKRNMTFGLYFSQFEWFNPVYKADAASNFTNKLYAATVSQPQLQEIVNTYLPDVVWSDGDAGPADYWNSTHFLAWLYNDSPVKDRVVVNDRWGNGIMCNHGDFYTCSDRYNPGVLQKHKWENCMTAYRYSWGYDRTGNVWDYLTTKEILQSLAETISCGGNLLLNVGPTHDGRIVPIFQDRLLAIGNYLKINGEAVYASKPWVYQNDTITSGVWYTCKASKEDGNRLAVYAFFFEWPVNGLLSLGAPKTTPSTKVRMLGVKSKLQLYQTENRYGSNLIVDLSSVTFPHMPSYDGWVLKFENLANV